MRKFTESLESDKIVSDITDILVDFTDNGYGVRVLSKSDTLFEVRLFDIKKTLKGDQLLESLIDINTKITELLGLKMFNYSISLESNNQLTSTINILYSSSDEKHSFIYDYETFRKYLTKLEYSEVDDDEFGLGGGVVLGLLYNGFYVTKDDYLDFENQEIEDYVNTLIGMDIPYSRAEEVFNKLRELI